MNREERESFRKVTELFYCTAVKVYVTTIYKHASERRRGERDNRKNSGKSSDRSKGRDGEMTKISISRRQRGGRYGRGR